MALRIPCDINKLYNSPDLPKSIYDEGEEIFGSSERDALIKEALSMGAQPPFAIGAIRPTFKYGLEFLRFNRIEGLSAGAKSTSNWAPDTPLRCSDASATRILSRMRS